MTAVQAREANIVRAKKAKLLKQVKKLDVVPSRKEILQQFVRGDISKKLFKLVGDTKWDKKLTKAEFVFPPELLLPPPEGESAECLGLPEGFYRSRLTSLGLLLRHEGGNQGHNSEVVCQLFRAAKSHTALLCQYKDLGMLLRSDDLHWVLAKYARLATNSEMSREEVRVDELFGILDRAITYWLDTRPGLQGGSTAKEKCEALQCLQKLSRIDLWAKLYTRKYKACIASIEPCINAEWRFEQLQTVADSIVSSPVTDCPAADACLRAITREIGTRSFVECDTAAVEAMISSVAKASAKSWDSQNGSRKRAMQQLLMELAVLCHANLDLLSPISISALLAGVCVPGGVPVKFVLAATQLLEARIEDFGAYGLQLMMEGYAKLCNFRLNNSYSMTGGTEADLNRAVLQGMKAIIQEVKSRGVQGGGGGLETSRLRALGRGVKGTKYRDDEVMRLLCEAAAARLERLASAVQKKEPEDAIYWGYEAFAKLAGDTLHACAIIDYHPGPAFLARLDKCIMQAPSKVPLHLCPLLLWSLAVLQSSNLECFPVLLQRYVHKPAQESLDVILDNQVFQALKYALHARHHTPDEPWRDLNMPQSTLAAYRENWLALMKRHKTSKFQEDVGARLTELGVVYSREVLVEEGTASVDMAFVFGSKTAGTVKVAIEVDGPAHFTINTLQHTGPTRMRDQLVRAEGWAVVNIPFFEYKSEMPRAQKYEYIRSKLLDVGYRVNRETFSDIMAAAESEEMQERKSPTNDGEVAVPMNRPQSQGLETDKLLKPRPQWQDPSSPYKPRPAWKKQKQGRAAG